MFALYIQQGCMTLIKASIFLHVYSGKSLTSYKSTIPGQCKAINRGDCEILEFIGINEKKIPFWKEKLG